MTTSLDPTFDHLIHWVGDLEGASAAYTAAGLPIHEGLTMPGFRNAVWGVDDERYVELATVDDWSAVSQSPYAEGISILRPSIQAISGSGLLTFGVHVSDVYAAAQRLRELGHDVVPVEVHLLEHGAGFTEVFVRDVPAYFPFFIAYSPPREEIAAMRAEHRPAQNDPEPTTRPNLLALLAHSSTPTDDARRLAEFIGCPYEDTTVALPGCAIHFAKGPTAGLVGFEFESALGGEPSVVDNAQLSPQPARP